MAAKGTAMQEPEQRLQNVEITASDESTATSAAHRFFAIAELFDAVMLLQRKPRQLFINLGVCRAWRNYISRSSVLRTHMLRLPGPAVHDPLRVKINPWVTKIIKSIDCRTSKSSSQKRRKLWAGFGSSLRRTLLAQSRVQDARLSIWMRIRDEDSGDTRLVTVKFADNYNPPLEVVASMMRERAVQEHGVGLWATEISIYWTKLYHDGVWRGDTNIASGLICQDRIREQREEMWRQNAEAMARYL
ncbi:hypothetical protein LTR17_027058 [Elasticomyces elasticus]|nr:hypothetical protein LTR17_027058 [Elasticomyces elasticus]